MSTDASDTCWNCGSKNFEDTPTAEYCPDCGIECNYHGGGTNDKYRAASREKHERERSCNEDAEWIL